MIAKVEKPEQPDREILRRYTNQPEILPADIRRQVEAHWGNRPVQLYALADLDTDMHLSHHWLLLGPDQIAVASRGEGSSELEIRDFERSRITGLHETPGLSCTVLRILGAPGEPALATLRYTHRQRKAMENIKYVLQQQIEGRLVETDDPDEVYVRSVADPIREAQATAKVSKAAVMWRLLGCLAPYKWQVAVGAVTAMLITGSMLIPPWLTGYLIDDIIRPFQDGSMSRSEAFSLALAVLGGIGGVILVRILMVWIRLRVMSIMGEHVAADLRARVYEHLQKLSLSYFSSRQTGSIITRVTSDTDRLWDFVAFGIIEMSLAVLMLIGMGIVLLALDWQLGLVLVIPVPVLLYVMIAHGSRMKRVFLRAWRKWSNLTDVVSDTIPGMRVVKAFDRGDYEIARFHLRNDDALRNFNQIHTIWTSFWPLLLLAIQGLMLVVWVLSVPRLLSGGNGATASLQVGTFVSFLLYMTMFMQPIETIGQMVRMLNRAISSAHRIFEVLDTEPEIVDAGEPVRLEPVEGRVTFEDVHFTYDGVRQVINGISFEVEPGEMIGLVGPSGAGKTTITNLLVRFYEPTDGRILIDGVDLNHLDTGHYRRQVGMVLQDPYLFHGSIVDNIRYGLPEATVEQVVEAARAANAHDFICQLPHGYDTIVGERGHTLSGGERQRVSIARAILCNPRLLILDEATSSVDTETERKIQEALDRLVKGRTVFAIAHRLSTLKRADRLLVIEDGRISEHGTHGELLEREEGTYKRLYTLQRELHEIYAV